MSTSAIPPRRHRLPHSRRPVARALVWLALIAATTLIGSPANAQEPENNRAGIVIDFGDGVVESACVDLGPDGQATGEEMLAAAGFDVLMEYSPMGGAVCKIAGQGCNYPSQPCWCECLSSPCIYWAYNHLENGQWLYSTIGASIYQVHAGDVEGWAWGAGSLTQGAAPPPRTFDQVCAEAEPTNTPTATATRPPTATHTATHTRTPLPTATWTPWPSSTPQPTATWTPWPSSTPLPSATWTPVPSVTPELTASWTPLPSATATATDLPLAALPVNTATWTPTPSATATQEPIAVASGPTGRR